MKLLEYKKPNIKSFAHSHEYNIQMLNAQLAINEMIASIPVEDIESICMDEIILKPKGVDNVKRHSRALNEPEAPTEKRYHATSRYHKW